MTPSEVVPTMDCVVSVGIKMVFPSATDVTSTLLVLASPPGTPEKCQQNFISRVNCYHSSFQFTSLLCDTLKSC